MRQRRPPEERPWYPERPEKQPLGAGDEKATVKALAVLRRFIEAMHGWEERHERDTKDPSLDPAAVAKDLTERLLKILEKHVVAGATPERAKKLFAGTPPDYDPETTRFLGAERQDDGKMVVRTLQRKGTPLAVVYRYTLAMGPNGWRIEDSKQRVKPNGEMAPAKL